MIGDSITLSIFGESHGKCVGGTLTGIPAGIELDMDFILGEIDKRRAKSSISTPRRETDRPKFMSGVFEGFTTGMPITVIFDNNNTRSRDYSKIKNIPRPSHADYVARIKYDGYEDYRGGGHFSARNTAVIVCLGAICKQILRDKNISIVHHIKSIGNVEEKSFLNMDITDDLKNQLNCDFPVIDEDLKEKMIATIEDARMNLNSVGGQVEIAVTNMPVGVGSPYFDRVQSKLGQLIFSVQGVKGMEIGKGFASSKLYGSEYNDEIQYVGDKVKMLSNNSGGLNGGITNGMPIVLNVAMRPTASIGQEQQSINMETKENVKTTTEGRHDPCIVHRGSHVLSNIVAFGILDMIYSSNK